MQQFGYYIERIGIALEGYALKMVGSQMFFLGLEKILFLISILSDELKSRSLETNISHSGGSFASIWSDKEPRLPTKVGSTGPIYRDSSKAMGSTRSSGDHS